MSDGYIQEEGWVERYRRVSTPVRRAAMENDKASLRRTLAIQERAASVEADRAITEARRTFDQALTLGEPAILPPLPDPKQTGRWKQILATLFSRKTIDD